MTRAISFELLAFVLTISPSYLNADIILVPNVSYNMAYVEDGPVYGVQDDSPNSFPASNSLIASIRGAFSAQSFSYTQSGLITDFQTTSSAAVSGFPSADDGNRYGWALFSTSFLSTTDATFSYSMTVMTAGSAESLVANLMVLDLDTFDAILDVYDTISGAGTLMAGHTYGLFGTVYAENSNFDFPSLGGTGFVIADMDVLITSTVPEPSSMALSGLGILALAGFGWRRRKIGATV